MSLYSGNFNIQPQKLVASQFVDNGENYKTDTRHRHNKNGRKSSNEQGPGYSTRAAKHRQTHSPQISMTFCPEKCNCGFTNRTNQLEVTNIIFVILFNLWFCFNYNILKRCLQIHIMNVFFQKFLGCLQRTFWR